MANTLKDKVNTVADAVEKILGSQKPTQTTTTITTNIGQSRLERVGIESRANHLRLNEWNKILPYSKLLVESEYDIQQEFEI